MANGDVRVFGLVVGTHVLEDIGMDVPHGREVTIPADKAARSKDLYKAINQKCIFKLPDQPVPQHVAPVTHIRDDILQERNGFLESRCKQLEAENKRLQEENKQLLHLSTVQQGGEQLETILKAIQGIKVAPVYVNGTTAPGHEVADGTAPSFIPAEIAPRDAESHIAVQRETGGSGISDAADKLRKLRQNRAG